MGDIPTHEPLSKEEKEKQAQVQPKKEHKVTKRELTPEELEKIKVKDRIEYIPGNSDLVKIKMLEMMNRNLYLILEEMRKRK